VRIDGLAIPSGKENPCVLGWDEVATIVPVIQDVDIV
jgi:hypothetical protein